MTTDTTQLIAGSAFPEPALEQASNLLSRAFFADPVFTRMQPADRQRARGLSTLYAALLRDAALRGGVLHSSEAVAAWLPMNRLRINLIEHIRRGYAKVPFHFGVKATWRIQAHDDWCNQRMVKYASEDAAYINCVGVEPSLAGRGIGSKLVTAAISHMGASFRVVALRTEQPKNVRFYEKLGFGCVEQTVCPKSGIPTWFFVREIL
jgi:ribosomal protein S18 acetylase RimI-like enzyme